MQMKKEKKASKIKWGISILEKHFSKFNEIAKFKRGWRRQRQQNFSQPHNSAYTQPTQDTLYVYVCVCVDGKALAKAGKV